MFIPIFIPRHDCDCDDSHGRGCRCPECLREEELRSKPREYYESRYAIPKKQYRINQFFRVLSFLPFIVWGIAVVMLFLNFSTLKEIAFFPFIVVLTPIGGVILAGIIFNKLDKLVKYEWNIKGAIRLEKKRWTNDSWDEIFKNKGVTKEKYHITKPEDNWRYE